MLRIRIIAEIPPFSLSYMKNTINQLRRVYPCKIIHEFCLSVSNAEVRMNHGDKIIFLTHSNIQSELASIKFDGIGFDKENIAILKYQKNSKRYCYCLNRKLTSGGMRNTFYLLLHELGHLMGLKHCENPKCLMGRINCNGMIDYCWRCLAGFKKVESSIFCPQCKARLKELLSL